MFLTTKNVIPISLHLQKIQIKVGDRVGDRLVVLNGVEVDTKIQGIGASLITRVDVYLGLNSLCREIYFRFTLCALSFYFLLNLLIPFAPSESYRRRNPIALF
jgi:hypothetical protein